MKETFKNLKKVYQYGKEYNKNLIFFTVLSFAFVIVNVIYPIFTAKQITYLSTGFFKQLASNFSSIWFRAITYHKNGINKRKYPSIFHGCI